MRLGELATIATGNTPPTGDASNYGDEFLFVGPVDMGDAKFISKTEKQLSKKGFAMSRRFPRGSILFVSIGSTIGKCGIAPVELASNQQINAVFPSPSFSVDYLYYAVCAAAPRIRAQAGEQAVPIVNKSQFSGTEVAIPPLPEQRAIANALSDVDELIATLDRLIAKKRDLKQGAMQQLLTGKTRLPGFSGKNGYKQTELGMIPEDWDVRVFFENFRIYAGGDVPKHSLSDTQSNHHPYPIFANALQNRGLYGYTAEPRAKADSLTITARGYLGHAEYRNEPYLPIVRLLVMEPIGPLDAKFTTYSVANQVEFASESTGVPQLTAPQLGNYAIAAPSLPEQSAIAAVLSDMDAELTALEARRDKTKLLKQGMMQELLTGKTRLV